MTKSSAPIIVKTMHSDVMLNEVKHLAVLSARIRRAR
jgi:hypothetical protein